MTTTTTVTEQQAQQVLEAIKSTFKSYLDPLDAGPVLISDHDGREWTILWEDGSPYEWTYLLGGGVDEEMSALSEEFGLAPTSYEPTKFPKGLLVEPINHISVGIYPA